MSVGFWDGAPEMEGALDSDGPCVGESVGFVVGCVGSIILEQVWEKAYCEYGYVSKMVTNMVEKTNVPNQ